MSTESDLAIALNARSSAERERAILAIGQSGDKEAALKLEPLLLKLPPQESEAEAILLAWAGAADPRFVAPTRRWLDAAFVGQRWGETIAKLPAEDRQLRAVDAALQAAAEVLAADATDEATVLRLVSLARTRPRTVSVRADRAIAKANGFPYARYGDLWRDQYRMGSADLREAALPLLARGKVHAAVPDLIAAAEAYEHETKGATADRIIAVLEAITDQKLGLHAAAWRAWQARQKHR
jgi:hypothetical protein